MSDAPELEVSRRGLLAGSAATAVVAATPAPAAPPQTKAAPMMPVSFAVNGKREALSLDPRTTLLDALREHLHLTGTNAVYNATGVRVRDYPVTLDKHFAELPDLV